MSDPRVPARVAFVAAGVNVVALLCMGAFLRLGLPGGSSTFAERARYISTHRAVWITGWLAWNFAAMSLLGFYVVLAERFRSGAPHLVAFALILATAGLAADLSAEGILMTVTPNFTFERVAITLTGFVGNGLYTLAGIALTLAARRTLSRALVVLGMTTWAFGLALAAATLARAPGAQVVTTALVMPLFILWALLVGRWLQRAS